MPDDDEAAAATWVEKALHDITRLILLDRNHPVPENEHWKQGAAPTSGPSFLVADGYLSRSAPGGKPRYRPLIELIGAELQAARPAWPVYGCSYRNPLRHYVRQDAQFNPMIESGQKFRAYLPNEGCHVTYIGYSLGASLYFWVWIMPSPWRGSRSSSWQNVVHLSSCVNPRSRLDPAFNVSLLARDALPRSPCRPWREVVRGSWRTSNA